MLRPTSPHLQRLDIRPGHWGQWLAIGAAGLVGLVVLALLQGTRGQLHLRASGTLGACTSWSSMMIKPYAIL